MPPGVQAQNFCIIHPKSEFDDSKFNFGESHVEISSPVSALSAEGRGDTFVFDKVFAPNTSQEKVFLSIAKAPVLNALDRFVSAAFIAFGATGGGKTFAITGGAKRFADRGLIPRSISALFEALGARADREEFEVSVSFYEIYKDKVVDLLSDGRRRVTVQSDERQGPVLIGLIKQTAAVESDAYHLLFQGDTNRHFERLPLNAETSRGHVFFVLNLKHLPTGREASLSFVDLAATISQRNHATNSITRSLEALRAVIVALRGSRRPPYESSILTQLLQPWFQPRSESPVKLAIISPLLYTDSMSKELHEWLLFARLSREALCESYIVEPLREEEPDEMQDGGVIVDQTDDALPLPGGGLALGVGYGRVTADEPAAPEQQGWLGTVKEEMDPTFGNVPRQQADLGATPGYARQMATMPLQADGTSYSLASAASGLNVAQAPQPQAQQNMMEPTTKVSSTDEVSSEEFEVYSQSLAQTLSLGHEIIRQKVLGFMDIQGRTLREHTAYTSNFPPFEFRTGRPDVHETERIYVEITIQRKGGGMFEVDYTQACTSLVDGVVQEAALPPAESPPDYHSPDASAQTQMYYNQAVADDGLNSVGCHSEKTLPPPSHGGAGSASINTGGVAVQGGSVTSAAMSDTATSPSRYSPGSAVKASTFTSSPPPISEVQSMEYSGTSATLNAVPPPAMTLQGSSSDVGSWGDAGTRMRRVSPIAEMPVPTQGYSTVAPDALVQSVSPQPAQVPALPLASLSGGSVLRPCSSAPPSQQPGWPCDNCGSSNKEDSNFCMKCGAARPGQAALGRMTSPPNKRLSGGRQIGSALLLPSQGDSKGRCAGGATASQPSAGSAVAFPQASGGPPPPVPSCIKAVVPAQPGQQQQAPTAMPVRSALTGSQGNLLPSQSPSVALGQPQAVAQPSGVAVGQPPAVAPGQPHGITWPGQVLTASGRSSTPGMSSPDRRSLGGAARAGSPLRSPARSPARPPLGGSPQEAALRSNVYSAAAMAQYAASGRWSVPGGSARSGREQAGMPPAAMPGMPLGMQRSLSPGRDARGMSPAPAGRSPSPLPPRAPSPLPTAPGIYPPGVASFTLPVNGQGPPRSLSPMPGRLRATLGMSSPPAPPPGAVAVGTAPGAPPVPLTGFGSGLLPPKQHAPQPLPNWLLNSSGNLSASKGRDGSRGPTPYGSAVATPFSALNPAVPGAIAALNAHLSRSATPQNRNEARRSMSPAPQGAAVPSWQYDGGARRPPTVMYA